MIRLSPCPWGYGEIIGGGLVGEDHVVLTMV